MFIEGTFCKWENFAKRCFMRNVSYIYGNVLWKDVLLRMFCIWECFIKGRFVNWKILLRDVLWGMFLIWECFVKGRFVKNVLYAMGCFFAGTSCTLHPYVYSILYSYIFLTPKAAWLMYDLLQAPLQKKHFSFHFYIFLVVGGFELWQIHYSKHFFWDGEKEASFSSFPPFPSHKQMCRAYQPTHFETGGKKHPSFLFSPFSFTQTNV